MGFDRWIEVRHCWRRRLAQTDIVSMAPGIEDRKSNYSVDDTVDRLRKTIPA